MGDDRRWKKVSAGELGSYSAMELGIKQRQRQGTAPYRRRDCIKVCAPPMLFLGFLPFVVFALYA